MALKRRRFTREFKRQILHEIDAGKSVSQTAREYQVHPNMISRWRAHYRDYGERAFAGNGNTYTDEAKIAALERKIGQLTMENDLLKKALNRLKAPSSSMGNNGAL
jgi:transposase